MRRIYYAFALKLATHPITMQSGLFVLALLVFAKLVHVSSVIENLLATNVANVPNFILGALMQGEVLTLIAVGVITFTMLSLPLQVRAILLPKIKMA